MEKNNISSINFQKLISYYNNSKFKEIISFIQNLDSNKEIPILYNFMGAAYSGLMEYDNSILNYKKSISLDPNYLEAFINLAETYRIVKDYKKAIKTINQAININDKSYQLYFNLGLVYQDIDDIDKAIACYKKVIIINPSHFESFNNLGILYKEINEYEEALECYQKALSLNLKSPEILNNIGLFYKDSGKKKYAMNFFQKALEVNSNSIDANFNMGNMFKDFNDNTGAISYYEKVLVLNPNHNKALSQKLFQLAQICDWDNIQKYKKDIKYIGVENDAIDPFTLLTFDDSLNRNKKRAELFAKSTISKIKSSKKINLKVKSSSQKIRIGYFSSDFYNHATMYLISRMLELHNKDIFEIYGYSYGNNVEDEMFSKCKVLFQPFRNLKNISDSKIKEIVKKDKIDIAIDLKGYTKNNRSSLFFSRIAPIQINFLGYPGTMGSKMIDYLIADRVVIPEKDKKYYNEQILYLPNCYQVTDNTRIISKKIFNKKDCQLPNDGFVFCCFNNSYKISDVEFKIWMRLLIKVPNSVLWLIKYNTNVEENIKKKAHKLGVNPSRIIFAEYVEMTMHLSRHSCADLFLDTFNVNAHTTASDALWSGVPVLTKIGNSFPSRVASSLLTAINMTELITETNKDYEALALEIALNTTKLKKLKNKLKKNIIYSSLFNTEKYTKDYENLLIKVINANTEL